MFKLAACALAVTTFAMLPSQAVAGGKTKLAVLDMQSTGVNESLAPTLTEILSAEIENLGRFEVIAGSDISAMLGFEAQKDVIGCDDAACIAEIGGALGVDKIVVGHVGKVGNTFVLNIKLLNIVEAKTEKRVYETVAGEVDQLIQTVRTSVAKLFAVRKPAPSVGEKPAPQQADANPAPQQKVAAKTPATPPQAATSPAPTEVNTTERQGIGTLPLTLMAVGGAGLIAGVLFGVRANNLANEADAWDPERTTHGIELEDTIDSGKAAQRVANLSYAIALIAGGTGITMWLLGGDDDNAVALTPWVSHQQAGIRVDF